METKSLPPDGNKRKDLFNRAVIRKIQLSLDRIDHDFWSLAMRRVKPMEDGRVLCNGGSMSMLASNDFLELWKNSKYPGTELNCLGLNTGWIPTCN